MSMLPPPRPLKSVAWDSEDVEASTPPRTAHPSVKTAVTNTSTRALDERIPAIKPSILRPAPQITPAGVLENPNIHPELKPLINQLIANPGPKIVVVYSTNLPQHRAAGHYPGTLKDTPLTSLLATYQFPPSFSTINTDLIPSLLQTAFPNLSLAFSLNLRGPPVLFDFARDCLMFADQDAFASFFSIDGRTQWKYEDISPTTICNTQRRIKTMAFYHDEFFKLPVPFVQTFEFRRAQMDRIGYPKRLVFVKEGGDRGMVDSVKWRLEERMKEESGRIGSAVVGCNMDGLRWMLPQWNQEDEAELEVVEEKEDEEMGDMAITGGVKRKRGMGDMSITGGMKRKKGM